MWFKSLICAALRLQINPEQLSEWGLSLCLAWAQRLCLKGSSEH